jgi:Glycosyl transferase family 2
VEPPSPVLAAARRLARATHAPLLPADSSPPRDADGAILLAGAPSDDLFAALPRAEALVLWLPGASTDDAVALLERHGVEHGSIDRVELPEPGTLAVLAADEARAEAHAHALQAPERPFRALAVMPAFNEADVIFHAIGALVSEGVDVYLLDHESTDGTAEAASPWLGHGLVRIERFPEEAGYPERNRTEMVWRDILRRVGEVTGEVSADWYLFVNADEFREAPWPNVTLADGLREVDDLGFNAVNFELLNFRPTPQDAFAAGSDVREHLRHYEPPGHYDVLQVKAWKAQPAVVDVVHHGGHDVLFAGKRVFPVPFLLRHYPIRSAEHGRRKVLAERLARFAAEERAGGWHIQYDHYADGADYLHDRATLVEYDPDRVRAALLARSVRELLAA